jgi:hypothetical protein
MVRQCYGIPGWPGKLMPSLFWRRGPKSYDVARRGTGLDLWDHLHLRQSLESGNTPPV